MVALYIADKQNTHIVVELENKICSVFLLFVLLILLTAYFLYGEICCYLLQNLTQEGSFIPWNDDECLEARPESS